MALRYPKDISSEYYIKFQFFLYEPPYSGPSSTLARANLTNSIAATNASLKIAETNLTKSKFPDIYLPMPAEIGSQYVGQWGGQDVNTATSAILGAAGGSAAMMDKKVSPDSLKRALQNSTFTGADAAGVALEAAFVAAKNFLNNTPLIGAGLASTNQLLSLGTTSILNPNTELLYNGTELRTHGYKFKLIPNSSSEATDIKQIVETFKKAALPKRKTELFGQSARNYIGIPDVCKVEFIKRGGGNNLNLPKYKLSAISNVDVNYITDGQYIEYEDGFPLGIELTLAFKELKLLFSEEIGEADGNYR